MHDEAAEARLRAKIVRVNFETGATGLYYATSPDLKGLLVAEHSQEAVEQAITSAITDLYAACGEQMVVLRVADEEGRSWVAFPASIAATALADRTSIRS